MKLWHAETVSGSAADLTAALQRIEDASGSIMGMTAFSGPYPSWTVVWYTYQRDARSENEGVMGYVSEKEITK